MIIKELKLKGVFQIQLETEEDFRGFFMQTYNQYEFKKYNLDQKWAEEYHNLSLKKGTIRGLHFQLPPHARTKLVRVIQGKTLDVCVDLRKNSPTFGKWDSVILSVENKKMAYIPRGFAHALCALEDNTMIVCKMDNDYAPDFEYQIKWDDPDLHIDWQIEGKAIVSEKDAEAASFKDFVKQYGGV